MSVLVPNVNEPQALIYKDADLPITFDWEFEHSNLAESQSEWALRRKEEGESNEWWDKDSETWVGSETYNVGSETSYTFDPGHWDNGKTYLWSLSTKDQDGNASDYTSEFPLDTAHSPVAAIIEPEQDDTFTSDTDSVIVAWSYSNDSGHPQQSYNVKVFQKGDIDVEADTPLWESGEVLSRVMESTVISQYLPVASELTAYVRVMSSVGLYSEWTERDFKVLQTLVVSSPTVMVQPDPKNGRNEIMVANTSPFSGVGASTVFVERSIDGITWNKVPGTDEVAIDDPVTLYDNVPLANDKVYYRARMVIDV